MQLRYDDIGIANGYNKDNDDNDPSNTSRLNLVTRDFPIGNGAGPPIEKRSDAAPRPPLTPGLAGVFDQDSWNTRGMLMRKTPANYPVGMQPYQGNSAPIFGLIPPPAEIGRSLGNYMRQSTPQSVLQDGVNVGTRAARGLGSAASQGFQQGSSWLQRGLKSTPSAIQNILNALLHRQ